MNRTSSTLAGAAWLVACALHLGGCASEPMLLARQDAEFAASSVDIGSVAIVPAAAHFALGQYGAEGSLDEHSLRIGADLDQMLAARFSDLGRTVDVIKSSDVYGDEVEHLAVAVKQAAYGDGAYPVPDSRPIEFSLGADIQPVADVASADVLVLTHFSGWKRTGGGVAGEYLLKAMFGGVATATGAADLFVAIVDADTGDVLWTNLISDFSVAPNPPDYNQGRLDEMLDRAFAELPLAQAQ